MIRVLELQGSSFEMGFKHGEAYREAIIDFTEERVRLSGDPEWSGRTMSRNEVLSLAEVCLEYHGAYAPDLVEELRGMAEATGLSLAELIVVGGFTDFIDTVNASGEVASRQPAHAGADNCTAFLVPNNQSATGQGFFGQTWDMHDSATPKVIMLRGAPEGKPGFLAFTTVGCVGMIGMNSEGLAIGINNLSGADGRPGVTWPFVIRKALEQTNADDALGCVTNAKLAGAHNYLIMDKQGRGFNVEASSSQMSVSELQEDALVHTNHCLAPNTQSVERDRRSESQVSSEARLERGYTLLEKADITEDDLQALTRDPDAICVTSKPPRHVETCGAAIMRPATGDFWAVWGLPSENDYEHFTV